MTVEQIYQKREANKEPLAIGERIFEELKKSENKMDQLFKLIVKMKSENQKLAA